MLLKYDPIEKQKNALCPVNMKGFITKEEKADEERNENRGGRRKGSLPVTKKEQGTSRQTREKDSEGREPREEASS